ncbi:MAG: tRNA (guanosine(37)-N1)-methyltransferase TrmD [Myxococcota bacterium]
MQEPFAADPFKVEVITLVPTIWLTLSQATGLVGASFDSGIAQCEITDLRSFGKGAHRQVDDAPFGGGAGMVLCVEPLHRAIIEARGRTPDAPVVLLSPRGRRFCQEQAREFATGTGLTLICGRYEGVDERVYRYVDAQLSLGDFVLSAGDPAAWAVIDAVVVYAGVLETATLSWRNHFGANLLSIPSILVLPNMTAPKCPTCCAAATIGRLALAPGKRRHFC